MQMLPGSTDTSGITVIGTGRDLAVDGSGRADALATSRLTASLDQQWVIDHLVVHEFPTPTGRPGPASLDSLVGQRTASGFRGRVTELGPDVVDPSGLPAAMLDDLPAVRVISGYAKMMEAPDPAALTAGVSSLLNICAGWAEGATADRRSRAGELLLEGGIPEAPSVTGLISAPWEFHDEPEPVARSMYRRRLLEVAWADDHFEIYSYFRDSYVNADLREGSLHEYVVRAAVSTGDLVLRSLDVEPRALPFPECPLGSVSARSLLGTSVTDLISNARGKLSGIQGCSHLTDVLRFLRFVDPLARAGTEAFS